MIAAGGYRGIPARAAVINPRPILPNGGERPAEIIKKSRLIEGGIAAEEGFRMKTSRLERSIEKEV